MRARSIFQSLSILVLIGLASSVVVAATRPRVIIISVDGLRPDAITADIAPHMTALREGGAHAVRAINDLPSITLPNHTSMLTGLPGDEHGVIANTTIPGFVKHPTIFRYARDAGLRSAFFASKEKMRYLAPPDDVETRFIDADLALTVDELLKQLTPDGPDLIFLHLREPDSTGHAKNWMTPEYLESVTRSDEQIGRIRSALADDLSPAASLAELPIRPTYMLITADHGGSGSNHFLNIEENRRIPWIVAGPDIAVGRTLTREVSTLDTAPTVLWLLGVENAVHLHGSARTAIRAGTATDADEPVNARPSVVPPSGNACILFAVPALGLLALARRRINRRRN